MKKFFILICIFFNTEVYAQSGWFTQPTGSNAFLWDIEATDLNTAFIAASEGTVYKTTNGGTNWIPVSLMPAGDFLTVDFPSGNTGYVAGSLGKIFKTVNSGVNWNQISSLTSVAIQTSYFINENTGFVAGGSTNDGEIFKTTNGGVNWNEYGPGTLYPQVVSIFFASPNTGYAVGINASILKSSNAGINWTFQQSGLTSGTLFSVFFTNENTGYATCPFPNAIIKTTNGGTNWNTIYNDPNFFPVVVYFTSADTVFVIGAVAAQTAVLKTTNAGVNWTTEIFNFTGHLNSIDFINSNVGYITGEFGRLYKTTNGGTPIGIEVNNTNIPNSIKLYQNYPNPFNPVTNLEFGISELGFVTLKVYDLLGKEIATLVNEKLSAGTYEVTFDGTNYPSGVYYYKLETDNFSGVKKMILLK